MFNFVDAMEGKEESGAPSGGYEKREHENIQVYVSTHRSFGSHMYHAEECIDQFGTVELHALGDASVMACEVADKLTVNGHGKIKSMITDMVELDGWETGYKDKKPKLLIILEKAN